MNETTRTVTLKPRRAKPFFLRHPWVFSGAIGNVGGSPGKGDVVTVVDANGKFVGRGFYNPISQIAVRLLTWQPDESLDKAFWQGRIETAIRLRRDILRLSDTTDAFRAIYSDSDGLPGLIADCYGSFLVVQFRSAGMILRRDMILDILAELLTPTGIIERSDEESSEKESIPTTRGIARGAGPAAEVEITCDGMRFLVDLIGGQKTGFFLDQRENRLAAAKYFRGRTVLDAFCYTGAFGIAACAKGGALEVSGLDRSEAAVKLALRNYALNNLPHASARVTNIAAELRDLKKSGRRFGAVVLDPPKFARSRQGVERALRAYRDLNLLAMQLLEPDGILVTCSCSGHVSETDFLLMLNEAAVESGVSLQVLERRGQSADHPIISSCPETAYLKCFIGRVQPGSPKQSHPNLAT